ncbi:MAG: tRNA (adenosine(37)-N6)-dimethylallyltransferase MiaA [Alphaproteobacteria bacterium]|nr:MAG: tRNA (adenosine(37)-N6)-dimethylallyltransferase MiaA [Alphaproteobacteria bacterium]
MTVFPKTVLIVAGPTAGGKSALALACARKWNGAVINADSMQIYDGLPTLTAHPSEEEKQEIPHKLYGALTPAEQCSAARWCDMALAEIAAAHHQNRLPIMTGGTGFYMKALTEGLSPIPDVPGDIRSRVQEHFEKIGKEAFAKELAEKDPAIAARIDMQNPQRMMRAMEVLQATGKSLSYWQDMEKQGGLDSDMRVVTVVLFPDRERLYARCDKRFAWMLEHGALEEVRDFSAQITAGNVPEDAPLLQALGFTELCDYLAGNLTREEAEELSCRKTRQYAKRQMTWFKNQMPDALFVDAPDEAAVEKIATRLQEITE